jgi:hypothetical protein
VETDRQEVLDWLHVAETVLGVAMFAYLLYSLVPFIHENVDGLARQVRSEWSARQRRQREINQMIFETVVIDSIMERGGDALAADLGLSD